MNFHRITLAGLLWLTLASCVPSQDVRQLSPLQATDDPARERPTPVLLMSTPLPADTPSSPLLEKKFVARTKLDLASQLNVAVDQINLVEAMPMTWLNAALGCPDPGKVYAQGKVLGYKITLEVNGMEYHYHTDQTGKMVFCPEVDFDDGYPTSPAKRIQTPTIHIGVPIK